MSRRSIALHAWLLAATACDPVSAAPSLAVIDHDGRSDVEGAPGPPRAPQPSPILAATAPRRARAPARERAEGPDEDDAPDGDVTRVAAEPVATIVREVFFGDRDTPAVALTFDDGPSREHTPRILDVLDREDARATFFVLGDRATKMPDLLVEIDEAGHEIGNHTWSHGSMRSMWASQIRDELTRTSDAVYAAIGRRPGLFRPPFGRYAPSALAVIGDLGMNVVLWSVDGEDWDREADAAAAVVVRNARPGDIVLLHDRTATTAQALPAIIGGLRARGFALVTVSELTGLPAYAPSVAPTG